MTQLEIAAAADGVYPSMPAAEYHAAERLSSGGARKLLQSQMHYLFARQNPTEPTAAMEFGSAVHFGVLEPLDFDARVKLGPNIGTRTKGWGEFCAANPGFICLTPDDHARALECIAAVRAHPAARRLLDGAEIEMSVFWHDGQYGVPCKARFDIRNLGGLADLKTTGNASPEAFARTCVEYLYHVQAWHYWNGAEHALNASPQFFAFVIVERDPPHAVAVRTLGRASLMKGARLLDEAMARYRDALATGAWHGYPDTIEAFELPRYALA